MKQIIAKKDFTLNGIDFFEGDDLKNIEYTDIVRLNEKGFIQPLNRKELNELKNGKTRKAKEVEDNG